MRLDLKPILFVAGATFIANLLSVFAVSSYLQGNQEKDIARNETTARLALTKATDNTATISGMQTDIEWIRDALKARGFRPAEERDQ